jgi:hypothetical protein
MSFTPDFQGVIETGDGAVVMFDYQGYGRAYPPGKRQIVCAAWHTTDHEKYKWLNDASASVQARCGFPTCRQASSSRSTWSW